MNSQFDFLQNEFRFIFDEALKAELSGRSAPRAACFHARFTLELIVSWLYEYEQTLPRFFAGSLSEKLHTQEFRSLVGQALFTKAKLIKDLGNLAAHDARQVPPRNAIAAVRELFHLSYWLAHTYSNTNKPRADLVFDETLLPETKQVNVTTLAQLREIARSFDAATAARDEAIAQQLQIETARANLEAELTAARNELAAIKAQNAATADTHDYNEEQTRDAFIDLLLHEAGWPLNNTRDREFPVNGMPNASGNGFVDYVLWDDDGKPLGLAEAKRTKRDAKAGQEQAKLYADCLERAFNQRPIIFYSNGYEHMLWDDMRYGPRKVDGFFTKDELRLIIQRRETLKPLVINEINRTIVDRPYQLRAILRVTEAFERDARRKALLVMATGAGKTRTVIALTDLLQRANWAKNILFLADRRELVRQAMRAFTAQLPSAAAVNLCLDKSGTSRVYGSTYPTMMGLIDETIDGKKRFGPGHFDLIIIDEAHRSIYKKYKTIFDYFDSMLVGLTATPKDEVDRDTYALFDLEPGMPTDAYTLDDAIADGYLVPPHMVSVPLKIQRDGVKYSELTKTEKEQWEELELPGADTGTGEIESGSINSWLFNTDTVDKALEYLMTYGIKVQSGDRLGKTIIFARNHAHATFIVERFDKNYPEHKGVFARVIDNQIEYRESLIDNLSRKDFAPHIAVSVDMLDTGIDIPEIVNLVFFKIVRSRTKFVQMLGRGTRKCENLFGPGDSKTSFKVFDFCQNIEYFNESFAEASKKIPNSLTNLLFKERMALVRAAGNRDGLNDIVTGTTERLQAEITGMNVDNFLVRPHRDLVERYASHDAWSTLDDESEAQLGARVAGLPSSLKDDNVDAKRFDLLMLRAQTALLRSDPNFVKLQERIVEIAQQLERKENIPMIHAQITLIQEIVGTNFWTDVTVPMLANVQRKLRGLVQLIDVEKQARVYTNFVDEIGEGETVELNMIAPGISMHAFKTKAQAFLRDHGHEAAIIKLRSNQPLNETDFAQLEKIFDLQGSDKDAASRVITEAGGFGFFLRSLTGVDQEAASAAFAAFCADRKLNANQLEFIDMIVQHVTTEGLIESKVLFASPFIDMHPSGLGGIFDKPADQQSIIDIVEGFKRNAEWPKPLNFSDDGNAPAA